MAIVDLNDLLNHARGQGYALAAFEVRDLAGLREVLAEGVRCQAPLILSPAGAGAPPADLLAAMETAAGEAAVPVAIHCPAIASLEEAVLAINRGCNGLGLAPALHGDAERLAAIAAMAHDCGVPVAAALPATVTGKALDAIRDSGADGVVLAAAAGAGAAREAGLSVWLGTAAGLSDARRAALLDEGVVAVAVGCAAGRDIALALEQWGARGHGAAALAACGSWAPVEHLIIYNVAGISEAQAMEMMAEGRRVLGAIPGVRRVFTGSAVQEGAAYRYCWLVRFVHPRVIDSYRHHPAHVAFADKRFRPVAGDRISIDYRAAPEA